MHPAEIYAKTENGIREVRERKLSLPIALRSLLIMIDGKFTVGEILERARALRVDEESIVALERAGLISKRFGAPSVADGPPTSTPRSEDEAQRFVAAQRRLSDLVNEHLGLRGYLLTMRLERASNLRDLHDLLPDIARALVKRIGVEAATPIVAELEQQIAVRPATP
jgi:hypothetical protein